MCNTDSILQIQEMYYIYVKYRYPGLQAKIMPVLKTNISFCGKLLGFCINKANTKPPTNVILEIDFQSRLRL